MRTRVGTTLTLVLAGLLWLSFQSSGALLVFWVGLLLTFGAIHELDRMGRFAGRALGLSLGFSAVMTLVVVPLAIGDGPPSTGPLFHYVAAPVCAGLAAALLWAGSGRRRPLADVALAFGLAPWIVPPLPALATVRLEFGAAGLVALIALAKVGDVVGYYVGSSIGRRHPFPRTSPGKTVAGCVASLLAGILAGALCVALGLLPQGRLGLAGGLLAGATVNLAAQAGDLFESRAKRWAGVKDSGTWFGPSGGMLDLIDSLPLAVPVALFSWPLLFGGA